MVVKAARHPSPRKRRDDAAHGKGSAGGMYRYYTCSTKARQGERGCRGLTVPMDKLDRAVVDHLEWRLLGSGAFDDDDGSVA